MIEAASMIERQVLEDTVMSDCPECSYSNRTGAILCEQCGADIYALVIERTATNKLHDDRVRQSPFAGGGMIHPIILEFRAAQHAVILEREGRVVLGRS